MISIYSSNLGCGSGACKGLSFDWLDYIPQASVEQPKELYVEVSFGEGIKKDFFRSEQLTWEIGDMVVVETPYGYDIGQICVKGFLAILQMKKKQYSISENTLQILRKANAEDLNKYTIAKHKEKYLLVEGRKIIDDIGLNMKLAQVYVQRDGRRATFYYTAEERIDFRNLLRQYAEAFNMKIDMRHTGVRQVAKQVGGLGTCGRVLCCSSWLHDPVNISTNVARYQGLHLNKSKMNGQCGRLKCCLNYELSSYAKLYHDMPEATETIQTNKGQATLIRKDIFRKTFSYKLENGTVIVLDNSMIVKVLEQNKLGKVFVIQVDDLQDGVVKSEQFSSVGKLSLPNLNTTKKSYKFNNKKRRSKL